jgi:Uma2 family endonuclease
MSTVSSTRRPESLPSHAESPATSSPPTNSPGQEFWSVLYRLTVQQYDRMIRDGIIREADRVELVEGLVVAKMGRNRPHVQAGVKGLRLLSSLIPAGWHVRKEDPIVASEWSKPEPDLAVVRGRDEDYDERDVTAADVALVVEIADSSLVADQQDMARVYSACRIPIYWIINLVELQVEVYSSPGSTGYQSPQIFKPGQEVPVIVDGALVGKIAAAELLPPRETLASGGES